MRGFKRKPKAEPTRRQRIREEQAAASFSYYNRRPAGLDEANTGRQLRRPAVGKAARRFGSYWIGRFGLAVLLVTALICLVDVSNLSTSPRVIVLGPTTGTALQSLQVYNTAAVNYLQSSVLNRNKLTVNTAGLIADLRQRYPELSDVAVTLPVLAHRPVVYIQASQPALVINSGSGSYIVDTAGRAVIASARVPAITELPVVTDQSGLEIKSDTQVLPASDVAFISTVATELKSHQVAIDTMTLPAATRELDVHIGGQPYLVKFNLQSQTARQQSGTFLAVRHNLSVGGITPGQYIDVRVDGRAYYK